MMTQRARVLLIAYATVTAMLFGSLALESWRDMGRAEAQPSRAPAELLPSPLVDAGVPDAAFDSGSAVMSPAPAQAQPVEQAAQHADAAWKLFEDYGPVWGGMLLLYAVGFAFAKRHPTHWINRGHALTGGVSALGVLGALLEANFTAASGAGVGFTLLLAVKLLLQRPNVVVVPPPPPASS